MFKVAVLLSIGRNPASGRERPSDRDASALELALRLAGQEEIHAVHAGDPKNATLSRYLGMGVSSITVLDVPAGEDAVLPLHRYLEALGADVIVSGDVAEAGLSSGMVPYLLAARMNLPLVPAVADATLEGERLSVRQALPRGAYRQIAVSRPCILTVSRNGPVPRQTAFGRARRGRIETHKTDSVAFTFPVGRTMAARPIPKRLRMALTGNAEERLRALTRTRTGAGQVIVNPSPDEAASAIYEYLVREKIL